MRRIITMGFALLLVLTLGTSSFALASGTQIWYLDDDADTSPGWADYVMFRSPDGDPVNNEVGYIEMASMAEVVWRTDEAAAADVTFPAGTWDGKVMMDKKSGYDLDNIVVRLGYLDSSGFTLVEETTLSGQKGNTWNIHYKIAAGSFTVPTNAYLALQMFNGTTEPIIVGAGYSHNWLKSPVTAPGYPIPEVAAGTLFALGLGGLATYVTWRRREQVPI